MTYKPSLYNYSISNANNDLILMNFRTEEKIKISYVLASKVSDLLQSKGAIHGKDIVPWVQN